MIKQLCPGLAASALLGCAMYQASFGRQCSWHTAAQSHANTGGWCITLVKLRPTQVSQGMSAVERWVIPLIVSEMRLFAQAGFPFVTCLDLRSAELLPWQVLYFSDMTWLHEVLVSFRAFGSQTVQDLQELARCFQVKHLFQILVEKNCWRFSLGGMAGTIHL